MKKTIVLSERNVFINDAAKRSLKSFKKNGGEVASTLKTLFSQEGKSGELMSYSVGKDGHVSPVNMLGKIETSQISNDIAHQIVAVYKAGFDPYQKVR